VIEHCHCTAISTNHQGENLPRRIYSPNYTFNTLRDDNANGMEVVEIASTMAANSMEEVELVGLALHLLFIELAMGLPLTPEGSLRLARVRDRLHTAWLRLYDSEGVREGPTRMGNTLLLLPSLRELIKTPARAVVN